MTIAFPLLGKDRAPTAAILTCSFRGDFDNCRLLCESVDRFVPESIEHRLYVPTADLALFAEFAGPRRKIVSEDTLLPWWMKKLPIPANWRKILRLPRRNIYLTPVSRPVRGWIAQQMMKIAAARAADSDVVVHVDSDTAFIHPMTIADLVHGDGRTRLYQLPDRMDLADHRAWHLAASHLLGLPPDEFHAGDYVDSLVVWRPDLVRALTDRITAVGGRDWRTTLARQQHLSEYILYGVFVERIVGLEQAGLVAEPFSLCHSKWTGDFAAPGALDTFVAGLKPEHRACLIQSTIPMSIDERRRLLARIGERAAEEA